MITIIINQDTALTKNWAWSKWTQEVITIYKGRETFTAPRTFLNIYTFITFSKCWNTGSYDAGIHIRGETKHKYRNCFLGRAGVFPHSKPQQNGLKEILKRKLLSLFIYLCMYYVCVSLCMASFELRKLLEIVYYVCLSLDYCNIPFKVMSLYF